MNDVSATKKIIKNQNKRGLGRGLVALMSNINTESVLDDFIPPVDLIESATKNTDDEIKIAYIAIDKIITYPQQRHDFNREENAEMVESIVHHGVIQPIIVRPVNFDGRNLYQIICGVHRWQAAQVAQLSKIPAFIQDISDNKAIKIFLIENIQRTNLTLIEEARAYQILIKKFSYTHQQLALILGKNHNYIKNLLNLLKLPKAVQKLIQQGKLNFKHAVLLMNHKHAQLVARQIIKDNLSVNKTKKLLKNKTPRKANNQNIDKEKAASIRALMADLSNHLNMKVQIDHNQSNDSGNLTVTYKNIEQLDALCARLCSL